MPSLSPDGALQRLAATAYTPQDDVHERLKAPALQITAEAQTSRAVERLRHEPLATLIERDYTTVQGHMLGELLVTLGRQLHEADKEETS